VDERGKPCGALVNFQLVDQLYAVMEVEGSVNMEAPLLTADD
jgi:hypothetical protein